MKRHTKKYYNTRYKKALELRRAGLTYTKIGEKLGVSLCRASQMCSIQLHRENILLRRALNRFQAICEKIKSSNIEEL